MEAAQSHEGEMACKSCAKLVNKEEINVCFQTSEAKNLILEHLNKSSEPYLAMMSLIWPDKVLKTTITRDLKCANCLNLIQNVNLDIVATGEWKEGVETETLQDYFDGFTDFNVQLSKDKSFHNDEKCDIVLLIIAKAKMFGGHCYLGLSQEEKMIYRYVNCKYIQIFNII